MSAIPAWDGGVLRPVDKIEVHRRGLRHKAVSVFVMAEGEILIQRRAAGKYHTPGLWANTCCTHPHWDETPEDCARRRLDEELGIAGLPIAHRDRVEYRAAVGGGLIEHEVVDLFTAVTARTLPLDPDPDEVAETRWIAPAALDAEIARDPARFTPWLRIYMSEHRQSIFGQATV